MRNCRAAAAKAVVVSSCAARCFGIDRSIRTGSTIEIFSWSLLSSSSVVYIPRPAETAAPPTTTRDRGCCCDDTKTLPPARV